MLHWAFDTMVGVCSALIALGLWLAIAWWRKRDIPRTPWFLRAVAVSGVASVIALECGWIVTEVGRQPWIVYNVMRTEDAVTQSRRRLRHVHRRARCCTCCSGGARRDPAAMARRWRARTSRSRTCPTARAARAAGRRLGGAP
jgi:hypothetical protein